MSDATIVAIVILIGVFFIMAITIIKAGIEAAIKMWGVMGALTGVAFGAITSFYFTNQANQNHIAQLKSENASFELALSSAVDNAQAANEFFIPLTATLTEKNVMPESYPVTAKVLAALPEDEFSELASQFQETSLKLENIKNLKSTLENIQEQKVDG